MTKVLWPDSIDFINKLKNNFYIILYTFKINKEFKTNMTKEKIKEYLVKNDIKYDELMAEDDERLHCHPLPIFDINVDSMYIHLPIKMPYKTDYNKLFRLIEGMK